MPDPATVETAKPVEASAETFMSEAAPDLTARRSALAPRIQAVARGRSGRLIAQRKRAELQMRAQNLADEKAQLNREVKVAEEEEN